MILNPPPIIAILQQWKAWITESSVDFKNHELAFYLAYLIRRFLGHQPWDAFLKTYQLYLQSIPFETAKAAWGINAAAAARVLHPAKP